MNMLDDISLALEKAGCPRKVDEIYDLMQEMGLWKWSDTSPAKVIASKLSVDIAEKGKKSKFAKFGSNCYGLRVYKAPAGRKGYVYILQNTMFKDYVKVGKAESVLERLISLNSAVPKDYEPKYVLVSTYYEEAESIAHALLRDAKYQKECEGLNDEYFHCTVGEAKRILEKAAKTLPMGDNEILKWNPSIEITFGTVKKGKIPKKYAELMAKGSAETVAGVSHVCKSSFGVMMPSGVTITTGKSSDTFESAIKQFGVDIVAAKFPNLLKRCPSEFPSYAAVRDVGSGWFLNVHGSTKELIRSLKRINSELDIGATIIEA